jgi:hypothetical protein
MASARECCGELHREHALAIAVGFAEALVPIGVSAMEGLKGETESAEHVLQRDVPLAENVREGLGVGLERKGLRAHRTRIEERGEPPLAVLKKLRAGINHFNDSRPCAVAR